jgi:putative transposase
MSCVLFGFAPLFGPARSLAAPFDHTNTTLKPARAGQWRWGSLYRWLRGSAEDKVLLAAWAVSRKPNWSTTSMPGRRKQNSEAVRRSVHRGSPLGDDRWSEAAVRRLGLESTLRPHGRPKKRPIGS